MAAEQAEDRDASGGGGDEKGADWVRVGHLNSEQAMFLMIFMVSAKVLFLFPTIMSQKTGSSAWLSVVLSTALGVLGMWGWTKWIVLTGKRGFVSSLRSTLGRILGDLTALLLTGVLLMVTGLNIRLFSGGAVIGIVPEFPLPALLAISILTAVYASWLGLEAVGRAAVFFFAPTLFSLIVVAAGTSRMFVLHNVTPIWGLGLRNTILQGFINAGAFGSVPALAVIKSYVRDYDQIPRKGIWSVIISGAILAGGLLVLAAIFPYPMSARKVEPLGVMARAAFFGSFLRRLEALFTFTWFFAASVQASFSYMVILLLFAQICGAGTFRPFVPAVASLTFGIAGLPANTLRAAQIVDRVFITGAGNAMLALGWVLYFVARSRRRQ